MKPVIVEPFSPEVFADIQNHVKEVRRIFDWPGIPLHDKEEKEKFNRWYWHNLPLLVKIHHSAEFIKKASELFGEPVKPSYVFLSMYNQDGVCPKHKDRPQCRYTIDLQISSDGNWPIYVEDKPYGLKDGQALCYSGTGQEHFRKPMKEDGTAKFMNLAFFHFVPVSFMGALN